MKTPVLSLLERLVSRLRETWGLREMVHLLLRVSLQCEIFEPETHFEAENIAEIVKLRFDTSNFELIIRLTRKHVKKQVHITKQGL